MVLGSHSWLSSQTAFTGSTRTRRVCSRPASSSCGSGRFPGCGTTTYTATRPGLMRMPSTCAAHSPTSGRHLTCLPLLETMSQVSITTPEWFGQGVFSVCSSQFTMTDCIYECILSYSFSSFSLISTVHIYICFHSMLPPKVIQAVALCARARL